MTTRSGSRVYRRQPRPLAPGACPHCGRTDVRLTPTGRRGIHRDRDGVDCTGSGVMVGDGQPAGVDPEVIAEVLAQEPADVRWQNRDRTRPANPWSGKATA
jgi:hypothetical protein